MHSQNVIYTENGILFSCKKNTVLTDATWMNFENIILSEISQTQKERNYMIPLYEMLRIGKFREAIEVIRAWRKGKTGNYCLTD